jgi:outer membrane protein assembly factor BamB
MVYALGSGSDEPFFPPFEATLKEFDADKDNRVQREEIKKNPEAYEHFGWLDANNDGYVDREEYDFVRGTSAFGHGLTAVRLGGSQQSGDITASSVAWRLKKNYPDIPAPLLYDGVLYFMKSGGIISSVDPVRGDFLKTDRTKSALEEYYASPVAGDGKVFMVSLSGKVTVLKAAAQWEILSVNDLGEESWATPAIAGGNIYIRTNNALYSFGEKTKQQ